MGNVMWKIMAMGSAVGASMVARKVTDGSWKFIRGGEPPKNPEDPDDDWMEAILFAILSGAIVGISRTVARRQAASIYKKTAGHLPKDLQKSS